MTTTHERTLEAMFYEAVRDNPQMAAIAAEARNNILDGDFYSSDVVDAAFQKWERDQRITLIDAFGFALIWAHYLSGDIACCSVPLPHLPGTMKRKPRLRATSERWLFKVMTNDGKTRVESSGPILADLGEALRTLQVHITHLSRSEEDTLYALTHHVRARMKALRGR